MSPEKNSPPSIVESDEPAWRRPHFKPVIKQQTVFRFLIMVASAVIIFAGIKMASAIVAPVLLALFLTIILIVPLRWLKSKGFSDFIALVIVAGCTIAIFVGIAWLVGNSLNDFITRLPEYQKQINQEIEEIDKKLNKYGITITASPPKVQNSEPDSVVKEEVLNATPEVVSVPVTEYPVTDEPAQGEVAQEENADPKTAKKEAPEKPTLVELDMQKVMTWVNWGATELRHLAESGFLIMIIALFMIFEATRFPEKVNRAMGGGPITNEHFHRIASDIRRYLMYKGGSNLISVTLVTIFYFWFGVPYALLWGLISFFLYFIPNIGSVISAIVPVLLVFMEHGVGLNGALGLVIGLAVIESLVGYGLEPRILGHGLGISTVVVFLSLIFWGWILGPTGLFLAAPLTIMVKIILQAFKETEWIAILLGDNSPPH